MQSRVVSVAAAIGLALFSVGAAGADGGNSATNAIGTAQVSPVTSDPAAAADSTLGSSSSTLPLTIGGTGGNSSSNSIGTAQAGGGNTAGGSKAAVQVSPTSASPSAGASTTNPANAGSADAGITLGQTPNSAQDQTGALQVGQPAAHADATPPALNTSLSDVSVDVPVAPSVSPAVPAAPSVGFTPVFHLASTGDLYSLTFRPELEIAPGVSVAFDPLATAGLGGTIAIDPAHSSSADRSLGTLQTGGVMIAPAATAASSVLGLALELGGASSVDGGSSSAADTIGTAQVGGGNSADPSYGTVQIGGLNVGPTVGLTSSEGSTSLGGGTGIAGGGNEANNSVGTAQVGGGNTANGSTGAVQFGPVRSNQALRYNGTRAGSGTLGGPTQIGGNGGNTATNSIGTVQIGGSSSQATPAPTAPGATGAEQLGEQSTPASAPVATPQRTIHAKPLRSTPALAHSSSQSNTTTRPAAKQPAASHGVAGAKKSGKATSPARATLPFTGLMLWPVLLGAAVLLLAGGLLASVGKVR